MRDHEARYNKSTEKEDNHCRYFHIQASGPLEAALTGNKFVERVNEYATECSGKYPRQFVNFPSDWTKENWNPGEIISTGGKDYLVPFVRGGIGAYKPQNEPEEEDNRKKKRILLILSAVLVSLLLIATGIYLLFHFSDKQSECIRSFGNPVFKGATLVDEN